MGFCSVVQYSPCWDSHIKVTGMFVVSLVRCKLQILVSLRVIGMEVTIFAHSGIAPRSTLLSDLFYKLQVLLSWITCWTSLILIHRE